MVSSRKTIEISKPPAEVWDFLMNLKNYPMWQSGLLEVKTTDGTRVGSVLTVRTFHLGKELNMIGVVTENNGHNRYAAKSTQGPITFESLYVLTPTNTGTRLDFINRIDTNIVFKLAQPVLQSVVDTKMQADLENLKAVMEGAA